MGTFGNIWAYADLYAVDVLNLIRKMTQRRQQCSLERPVLWQLVFFWGGGHGEIFNDFIALVSAHETVQFYIHLEAEKKNQFSFFVLLFST